MDNILGTIVFLLPGFLMYFWLQAFGINPVVKHTQWEFTAVSALLWLPASFTTLMLYNFIAHLSHSFINKQGIWTLDQLKAHSSSIYFLIVFLLMSTFVSFIISVIWSVWIYPLQMRLINKIRNLRGAASYSKNPSVWDEVFTNNDSQVVEIGRIDKAGMNIIGCINKASRTFEPERHLYLDDIDFFTDLVVRHGISVSHAFYDVKSGSYVKVFDAQEIKLAQLKDLETTSSSDQ